MLLHGWLWACMGEKRHSRFIVERFGQAITAPSQHHPPKTRLSNALKKIPNLMQGEHTLGGNVPEVRWSFLLTLHAPEGFEYMCARLERVLHFFFPCFLEAQAYLVIYHLVHSVV